MESSLWPPEQEQERRGVPLRALAGSLALHALVLGALAPETESATAGAAPAAPLHAALRPPAPPAVPPEPVAAAPVPPPRVAPARPLAQAVPAAPPAPSFAAAPVPLVSPAPPVPVTAAAAAGEIPAPHAVPEPATAALASPAEAPGPDAAGLRQYRIALAGEARRFRRYPEAARRAGLSGTAEIRVTVAAGARSAELSRSSGHAALDDEALDMLRQAAVRARLPESLQGRDFTLLLPVVFGIEE